jgi:hypothetical protein
VLHAPGELATTIPGVAAVALVGSWARGAARADSDVDVVVLLDEPSRMLDTPAWHATYGEGTELIRAADFGAIQERRLLRPDGLVVEVGIGRPSLADVDPVDPGTARVTRDGLVPLHDPRGLLARLLAAVPTAR